MADSKWDKEMAKIDRQLESVSDEALFPTKANASPAARAETVEKRSRTSTLGVVARLLLTTALAVGIVYWPYDARCGLQLAYYLLAICALTASGVWSAIWSWRHRSGRAHTLSLLLIMTGLVLGAMEILPRVGYATPSLGQAATWSCS
jgi:hypothetical protein